MRLVICILIFISGCHERTALLPQYGRELGAVSRQLKEASGLVASISNPGFLWSINDSGNPAEIFLIDQQARIRLVCKLAGIKNRDWEDIAIGTSQDGKNYLYIADIGDNFLQYDDKMIYKLVEPILGVDNMSVINEYKRFTFRIPGSERNAETIMLSSDSHDIYIVSKEDMAAELYRAPYPLTTDSVMTMERVMTLPFSNIVSGSISRDGRQILLKNYEKIYYWERGSAFETMTETLSKAVTELPYQKEKQGESICWSNDGTEFYTLSESVWWQKPASLIVHKKMGLSERTSSNWLTFHGVAQLSF